jgi:argininosuccinate lyase
VRLWGGRFAAEPDRILWAYSVTPTDRRLLEDDLEGSLAHVAMLAEVGLLTSEEHRQIEGGLQELLAEARAGRFAFAEEDEDVHAAVERRLTELVGEVGGKLHTGRSRNDQVATDLRRYLRRMSRDRAAQLAELGLTLAELATAHATTIVPAYTHLQQAQAIPLGHHLLAYAWMARRDRQRFLDVHRRLGESPLGAGAAGGSSLPLDPAATAQRLGFDTVFANSLDAVGSRDLVAEHAWCCAQAMVHLSRLAEELILWATTEFGWVSFGDAFTTGSSALPQKQNPDLAELARGRSAGVLGNLTALLALQKGLPLAYNRDLQEDKEHVFAADDTLASTLVALTALLRAAEFHPPAPPPLVTALDLAEALVGRGVPFREAHRQVGRLVARLLADGRDLGEATPGDLAAVDPRFQPQDLARVDPAGSVARRVTPGGGSAASVAQQVAALRQELQEW